MEPSTADPSNDFTLFPRVSWAWMFLQGHETLEVILSWNSGSLGLPGCSPSGGTKECWVQKFEDSKVSYTQSEDCWGYLMVFEEMSIPKIRTQISSTDPRKKMQQTGLWFQAGILRFPKPLKLHAISWEFSPGCCFLAPWQWKRMIFKMGIKIILVGIMERKPLPISRLIDSSLCQNTNTKMSSFLRSSFRGPPFHHLKLGFRSQDKSFTPQGFGDFGFRQLGFLYL